ncbi:MAG: calcium-transporting P-type ATPase, PMR1-type [Chloroflexi bacterium]|nr:calcium-transporting P-type ATPase, PMR1-type [Chloroflexota bacterium]
MAVDRKWFQLGVEDTFKAVESSPKGLGDEEARRRLAQYGPNELAEKGKQSPILLLIEQFKSPLILILLAACIVSVAIGEVMDAIVIFAIVFFCAMLGFVQEFRSEKAMEALKKMAAPMATVLRGREETQVPAAELVPGDVVIIHTGDRIPADSRLTHVADLQVDEASLTGESNPVPKFTHPIEGEEVPLGDRRNMVYMGTAATYGRGEGVVVATGMKSEFGKIAQMIQEVEEGETPLQESLGVVGKWLGIGSLAIVAFVALLGVLRGHEILEMFIWAVSLAVAAVPEALPAVVTISLAIGVQRIARRNGIIRKLPAVETLGCCNYICSDKTGTLTQNEMSIRKIYVNGDLVEVTGVGYEPKGDFMLHGKVIDATKAGPLRTLLESVTLCNDSRLVAVDGAWKIHGDPTEGAMVVAAAKAGISHEKIAELYPRVGEIPFSSETKRMTTIHQTPAGQLACAKGAPEVILDSCVCIHQDGKDRPITDADRQKILEMNQQMASDALRVLAVAHRPLNGAVSHEAAEQDMAFVGLVGMIDAPREEVKDAIKECDRAGIRSVMITGDHKLTAVAVARELGLMKEGGLAVTGAELDKMGDEDFDKVVEKIQVYARVSPSHKLRVVEALQKKRYVTAMTGDGVNDAPALKKADIGVAMGITGTDVSKEAAAMILVDDNFASIVAAVEEGRGIFGNIKKYLAYLLAANAGEIILMIFASMLGLPLPLIAIQLLWLNLTTDGLPALALAIDPPDPDIMDRPPRDPNQGIFTGKLVSFILVIGLLIAIATFVVFYFWADVDPGEHPDIVEKGQTMAFTTITMFEMFHVFNCRSGRHSIFKIGFFSNRWMVYAVALSITMQVAVVQVPFLQPLFHTQGLEPIDWLVVVLVGSMALWSVELWKLGSRRLSRGKESAIF